MVKVLKDKTRTVRCAEILFISLGDLNLEFI